MFERWISQLLQTYLGSFVKLDAEQLRVGVWSGQLHLNNLDIKNDVLDSALLPATLVKGVIGTFNLTMNWARFGSVPVRVQISDVYLLLRPRTQTHGYEMTEAEAREYLQSCKRAILDAAQSSMDKKKLIEKANKQNNSYAAGIIANIIDNIYIRIKNLHICLDGTEYSTDVNDTDEEETSDETETETSTEGTIAASKPSRLSVGEGSMLPLPLPPRPRIPSSSTSSSIPLFTCGITLEDLIVQTTDQHGTPTFVKSTGSYVYKQVDMSNLCVYWTPYDTLAQHDHDMHWETQSEFYRIMGKPFLINENKRRKSQRSETPTSSSSSSSTSPSSTSSRSSYIIHPIDASVSVRLAKTHSSQASDTLQHSTSSAKIYADINIGDITIELSSRQYSDINSFLSSITSYAYYMRHAPFLAPTIRPSTQIFINKSPTIIIPTEHEMASQAHHSHHHHDIGPLLPIRVTSARAWWHYVIGIILARVHEKRMEHTWHHIHEHTRDRRHYVTLYKRRVQHADGTAQTLQQAHGYSLDGPLSQDENNVVLNYEKKWSAKQILLWRQIADQELKMSAALAEVTRRRGKTARMKSTTRARPATTTSTSSSTSTDPAAEIVESASHANAHVTATDPNATADAVTQQVSGITSWLSSWFTATPTTTTSTSTSSSSDPSTPSSSADNMSMSLLTQDERDQLLEILGYDQHAVENARLNVEHSRDALFDFKLKLAKASVTLLNTVEGPGQRRDAGVMTMPFLDVAITKLGVSVRETDDNLHFDFSLENLHVEDKLATSTRFQYLVCPQGKRDPRKHTSTSTSRRPSASTNSVTASSTTTTSTSRREGEAYNGGDDSFVLVRTTHAPALVHLAFTYNFVPNESQPQVLLSLQTRPLDMIYSTAGMERIVNFFTLPAATALWQELEVRAFNALNDLKSRTQAKLEYILENHIRMSLDVQIQAPTILLYHMQAHDHGAFLAVNLGNVNCATPKPPPTVITTTTTTTGTGATSRRPAPLQTVTPASSISAAPTPTPLSSTTFTPHPFETPTDGEVDPTASTRHKLSSSISDPHLASHPRVDLFYDTYELSITDVEVQLVPLSAYATWRQNAEQQRVHSMSASAVQASTTSTSSSVPHPLSLSLPTSTLSSIPSLPIPTSTSDWHVVDRFSASFTILNSVLPSDTSITRMKLRGEMPPLQIRLSSTKYRRICAIVESFTPVKAVVEDVNIASQMATPAPSVAASAIKGIPPSPTIAPMSTLSGSRRDGSSTPQSSSTSAAALVSPYLSTSTSTSSSASLLTSALEPKLSLPAEWIMLDCQFTAPMLSIHLSIDHESAGDAKSDTISHRKRTTSSTRSEMDIENEENKHDDMSETDDTWSDSETSISIEDSMEHLELATLSITGLSLTYIQRPYDNIISAQVNGLYLEDCIHRDNPMFRYIIASTTTHGDTSSRDEDDTISSIPSTQRTTSTVADLSSIPPTSRTSRSASMSSLHSRLPSIHADHFSIPNTSQSAILTPHTIIPTYQPSRPAISVSARSTSMDQPEQPSFQRTTSTSTSSEPSSSSDTDSSNLIHIVYRAIDPTSTLYATADVGSQLDLECNTLHISWNRTTISLLVDFFQSEQGNEMDGDGDGTTTTSTTTARSDMTRSADWSANTPRTKSTDPMTQSMSALELTRTATPKPRLTASLSPATKAQTLLRSPGMKPTPSSPAHLRTPQSRAQRPSPAIGPSPSPSPSPRTDKNYNNLDLSADVIDRLKAKIGIAERLAMAASEREDEKREEIHKRNIERERDLSDVMRKLRLTPIQVRTTRYDDMKSPSIPETRVTSSQQQQRVDFRVVANMKLLTFGLNEEMDDLSIAKAELSGFHLDVGSSTTSTSVSGTLGNLTITDSRHVTSSSPTATPRSSSRRRSAGRRSSSATSTSSSSSCEGTRMFWKRRDSDRDLISFTFNSYNYDPIISRTRTNTSYPGHDSSLDIRMSSVQCVVVHDFITALSSYLHEGLLRQATEQAAAVAKEALDTLREEAASQSTLFKYNVSVDNPLLFLPHRKPSLSRRDNITSLSDEYLVLDLGKIAIGNEFYLSDGVHHIAPRVTTLTTNLTNSKSTPNLNIYVTPPVTRAASLGSGIGNVSHVPSTSRPPFIVSRLPMERLRISMSAVNMLRASSFASHEDEKEISTSISTDMNTFWKSSYKKQLLEEADIKVIITTPLAGLKARDVSSQAIHCDVPTVHILCGENEYAFLLACWRDDLSPLFTSTPPQQDVEKDVTMDTSLQQHDDLHHVTLSHSASLTTLNVQQQAQIVEEEGDESSSDVSDGSDVDEDEGNHEMKHVDVDVGEGVLITPGKIRSLSTINEQDDAGSDVVSRSDVDSPPRIASRSKRKKPVQKQQLQRDLITSTLVFHLGQLVLDLAVVPPTHTHHRLTSEPFARLRVQSFQLSQRVMEDTSMTLTCTGHLALQDTRVECAHPMYRQILGGHMDEVSRAPGGAASGSGAGQTQQAAPHVPSHVTMSLSGSSSPPIQSLHASSTLYPSQLLLSPNSPSIGPQLEAYARAQGDDDMDDSMHGHDVGSVPTPLPRTILPDLDLTITTDAASASSIACTLTAPRLVISPGTIAAFIRVADRYSNITNKAFATTPTIQIPSTTPSVPPTTARALSKSTAASVPVTPAPRTSSTIPNSAPATSRPAASASASASAAPTSSTSLPGTLTLKCSIRIVDPQIWIMAAMDHDPQRSQEQPLTPLSSSRRLSQPDKPTTPRRANVPATSISCLVLRCHLDVNVEMFSSKSLSFQLSATALQGLICYRARHLRLSRLVPAPVAIFEPINATLSYQMRYEMKEDVVIPHVETEISPNRPAAALALAANRNIDVKEDPTSPTSSDTRSPTNSIDTSAIPKPTSERSYLNRDDNQHLVTTSAATLPSHHLKMDISNLDTCFSFLQIATIASIMTCLIQDIGDTPDDIMAASTPIDTSTSDVVSLLDSFRGEIMITTAGVKCAIVNDAPGYYVPLLSFVITPLTFNMMGGDVTSYAVQAQSRVTSPRTSFSMPSTSTSTSRPSSSFFNWSRADDPNTRPSTSTSTSTVTRFTAHAGIEGNYYNRAANAWEPFFDKWSVEISGTPRSLILTSPLVFNINITESLINTAARGLDSFESHFMSSIKRMNDEDGEYVNKHKKAAYFKVRNETGTRIRFWAVEEEENANVAPDDVEDRAIRSGANAAHTIDAGGERTLELRQYIGDTATDALGRREWKYRSPAVGLQVEAGKAGWYRWAPIEKVALAPLSSTGPALRSTTTLGIDIDQTTASHTLEGVSVHPLIKVHSVSSQPNSNASTPRHTHDHMNTSGTYAIPTHMTTSTHSLSSSTSSLASDDDVDDPYASLCSTFIACRVVASSDGSAAKVLVVSSAIVLLNRTFVDMEIRLEDTVADELLFETTLGSGKCMSLPVCFVSPSRVKLTMRPAGNSYQNLHWLWSRDGLRLSYLPQPAFRNTVIKCHVSPGENEVEPGERTPLFSIRLNVFETSAPNSPATALASSGYLGADGSSSVPSSLSSTDTCGFHPSLYTIAIDAPLSFRNLLGCHLQYQVTLLERPLGIAYNECTLDKITSTAVIQGDLSHKQDVHWYNMDLGLAASTVVTLQIRRSAPPPSQHPEIEHHPHDNEPIQQELTYSNEGCEEWTEEWSAPVVIHSTITSIPTTDQLVLVDAYGVPLHLFLDYSNPDSNTSSTLHSKRGHTASLTQPSSSSLVFPFAAGGPGLVTLYTPYWFLNRSGLHLVYASAEDAREGLMCAGQNRTSLECTSTELALADADQFGSSDTTYTEWYHFAGSRRKYTRQQGLDLVCEEISIPEWSPALRQLELDQDVFVFSFSDHVEMKWHTSTRERNRRACIRLPNTDWSTPFSVDSVGTDGAVYLLEVRNKTQDKVQHDPNNPEKPLSADDLFISPSSTTKRPLRLYEVGVSVTVHPNYHLRRTKVISFHPRFILINETGHSLQYRQCNTTQQEVIVPGQQRPLHRYDSTKPNHISLRVQSYGWKWAARRCGIAIDTVGLSSVRLRNTHTHEIAVFHIWTRLVAATFEVRIVPALNSIAPSIQPHGMTRPESTRSSSASSSVVTPVLSTRRAMTPIADKLDEMTWNEETPSDMTSDMSMNAGIGVGRSSEPVPYRLENFSLHTILFHQEGEDQTQQQILPYHACPYAWDEPLSGNKRVVLQLIDNPINNLRSRRDEEMTPHVRHIGVYSLDSIAKHPEVTLSSDGYHIHGDKPATKLTIHVYADGRVRVLRISDLEGVSETQDPFKQRRELMTSGGTSLDTLPFDIEIHLAGMGISLITTAMQHTSRMTETIPITSFTHRKRVDVNAGQAHKRQATSNNSNRLRVAAHHRLELLYLSVSDMHLRLSNSRARAGAELAIGSIQIDNQLHAARYPVVLCPMSVAPRRILASSTSTTSTPPAASRFSFNRSSSTNTSTSSLDDAFLNCSILISHDKSNDGFLFFPYFSVRMQQVQLNLEEELVTHLLHFTRLVTLALPQPSVHASAIASAVVPQAVSTMSTTLGKASTASPSKRSARSARSARSMVQTRERERERQHPHTPSSRSTVYTTRQPSSSRSTSSHVWKQTPSRVPSLSLPADEIPSFYSPMDPSSWVTAATAASLMSPTRTPARNATSRDAWEHKYDDSSRRETPHGRRVQITTPPRSATHARHVSSATSTTSTIRPTFQHGNKRPSHPVSSTSATSHTHRTQRSQRPSTSTTTATRIQREMILYFQELIIHPIQINVSYSAAVVQDDDVDSSNQHTRNHQATSSSHSHNPLRVLLRAVGVTLLNIENAPLRLNALHLFEVFASSSELQSLVQTHYTMQGIRQMYKLLGASDILGNPVALLSSISTGVVDFFYEPALGIVKSPQAFGTGIARGTISLVQHSLFGVSNTTSSVLSSLSKGLSSLAMIDGHIRTTGVGGVGMWSGLQHGSSGLVRIPVRGFAEAGVSGAVFGGIRAAIGFIVLPMAGIISFAASAADTVRQITSPAGKPMRMRYPSLFEYGLLMHAYPHPILRYMAQYLHDHPTQSFFAWVEESNRPLQRQVKELRDDTTTSPVKLRERDRAASNSNLAAAAAAVVVAFSNNPVYRTSVVITNERFLVLRTLIPPATFSTASAAATAASTDSHTSLPLPSMYLPKLIHDIPIDAITELDSQPHHTSLVYTRHREAPSLMGRGLGISRQPSSRFDRGLSLTRSRFAIHLDRDDTSQHFEFLDLPLYLPPPIVQFVFL